MSSSIQEGSNPFAEGRTMAFDSCVLGHLQEEPKNTQELKRSGQDTMCPFSKFLFC